MARSFLPRVSTTVSTNDAPVITRPDPYGITAFGETRVASAHTLSDNIHKYNIDPLLFATLTVGGGAVTYVPLQSAANLSVGPTTGDRAVLQTNQYFRYQAGKGLRFKMTAYQADLGQVNQARRWGFFDDFDGLFWELNGTTFSVVRRTSTSGVAVDTPVNQASWNHDRMDGTGPSGMTLNLLFGSIFEVDFQWLSVGKVRFFINGFLVHTMDFANSLTAPYMRIAQLPLQWEIVNTGASVASSFTEICSTVLVEGDEQPPIYSFNAFNAAAINVNAAGRPILSIRPKLLFGGIANRILVLPLILSIATSGSRAGFRMVLDGALTGAAFASVGADSGVEFDVAATAIVGGQTLFRTMVSMASGRDVDIAQLFREFGRNLRIGTFGTGQNTLTIVANDDGGGATDVRSSLTWNEVR